MDLRRMDPETWSALQKARKLTSGSPRVTVSWEAIGGLALRVAADRGYDLSTKYGEIDVPDFFPVNDLSTWETLGVDPQPAVAWLEVQDRQNAVYLELLVMLFVRRLKLRRTISTQSFATWDQVGQRTLLEYGLLDEEALTAFLPLRKWIMDIDNRSGQETGYLYDAFVPRILGGKSYGPSKSPIWRKPNEDGGKSPGRRQVDCIVKDERPPCAYEVKTRITEAASGRGRLKDELSFPEDCTYSGYVPRLLVFDPTACRTLDLTIAAFEKEKGDVFLGQAAYDHIEAAAEPAQAEFLRRYVTEPLEQCKDTISEFRAGRALPDLRLSVTPSEVRLEISGFDPYVIEREAPRS